MVKRATSDADISIIISVMSDAREDVFASEFFALHSFDLDIL